MKARWIPIGVLLGVGLGWVLAGLYHADRPSAAPGGERAAGDEPPADPLLRGRPEGAEPESGRDEEASPPVEPSEPQGITDYVHTRGLEDIAEWEGGLDPKTLDQRGWHALLTLYAIAGRGADFDRVVPHALAAGVAPPQVLELLRLLPAEQHVAILDGVRERFPDAPWPVSDVASIYARAGAGERAFDVLVPALEEEADATLAKQLVRASPDRAARVLGAMATSGGWTGELLGDVGSAFVENERPDLALPFLRDALARQPLDRDALTSLAQVDRSLAIAHAKKLTETERDNDEVWSWLGELQLAAGDREGAFEAYRQAATRKLNTDYIYGMMRADPERAFIAASALTEAVSDDEILGAVAKVAIKTGRDEDTLATLRRAHQRDPTDHEWMVAMVALDPTYAADVLRASARQFRGDSRDEILGAYANALAEMGRSGEAFDRYREAYEEDPSDWEWQRGMARADPQRALPLLRARREEVGEEGDLLGAIADAYLGTGRREEAKGLYEEALAAGGGDEWYARLALVDPEGATRRLLARTHEQPDSAEVWAALGDLYENVGSRKEARAAYGKARELSPTSLLYEIRYRNLGR